METEVAEETGASIAEVSRAVNAVAAMLTRCGHVGVRNAGGEVHVVIRSIDTPLSRVYAAVRERGLTGKPIRLYLNGSFIAVLEP